MLQRVFFVGPVLDLQNGEALAVLYDIHLVVEIECVLVVWPTAVAPIVNQDPRIGVDKPDKSCSALR